MIERVKDLISEVELWWFDSSRRVKTSDRASLKELTIASGAADGYSYIPSRAARARLALQQLSIEDYREYTFVDIGSGKGKVLFLAAEYPFRRIEGVEFALELHRQAQENIRSFRSRKQKCTRIESVNVNAVDYRFPLENLVVYLFNPFRPAVMETVLSNLEASLDAHPREVLLALVYPDLAPVVRRRSRFRPLAETSRYCIYRALNPQSLHVKA